MNDNGVTTITPRPQNAPPLDLSVPCNEGEGTPHVMGYRRLRGSDPRRGNLEHRVAWENEVGPIPEGLDVHHACEHRACREIRHLEVLTRQEHADRHRKPHCAYGHPLNEANVYNPPSRPAMRQCRTCMKRRSSERNARLRAIRPDPTPRKLTDDDVRFVRSHYVSGSSEWGLSALARRYGTSIPTIHRVLRRETYADVEDDA